MAPPRWILLFAVVAVVSQLYVLFVVSKTAAHLSRLERRAARVAATWKAQATPGGEPLPHFPDLGDGFATSDAHDATAGNPNGKEPVPDPIPTLRSLPSPEDLRVLANQILAKIRANAIGEVENGFAPRRLARSQNTQRPRRPPPTKAPPTEAPPTEAPPTNAPPTEPSETEAAETEAPTKVPTKPPVTKASKTKAPTKAPETEAPATEAPTKAPTNAPKTTAPTKAPLTDLKPQGGAARNVPVQEASNPNATNGKKDSDPATDAAVNNDAGTDSIPPELLKMDAVPKRLTHLKKAALVVLCYNRPSPLTETLRSIQRAVLAKDLALYVSQDGDEYQAQAVAQSFERFKYLSHPRTLPDVLQQNTSDSEFVTKQTPGTMFLAAHYKWVLDKLFVEHGHSHVIIVEDDMRVSKDFVVMFEALAPLLDGDPSLWCISSWNDNGFRPFDLPANRFFRNSIFPGLGWMLSRKLWVGELSAKWPADNWDHWMRASSQHKGRDCICPYLSRNRNIGDEGATANKEFYDRFLKPVQFHEAKPFAFGDLSYLLEGPYVARIRMLMTSLAAHIVRTPVASLTLSRVEEFQPGTVAIVPFIKEEFDALGTNLQIHPSPRAMFRGVAWLRFNEADIFLVDRRLSPFAPDPVRVRRHPTLRAVKAAGPGASCREVCADYSGGASDGGAEAASPRKSLQAQSEWACAADQFEFINNCEELGKHFGGCPYGCTQGWGEDIPNMETWPFGHPPQCLVTEGVPLCEGQHRLTVRLCPCTTARVLVRAKQLEPTVSTSAGMSCDQTCAMLRNDDQRGGVAWACDETQFEFLNTCDTVKKYFSCESCGYNYGADLPNFVVAKDDGNQGKCLLMRGGPMTCQGSHRNTLRLCPCVPEHSLAKTRGGA